MKKPEKEAHRWFAHARDEFFDAEELRKRERFYLALFHFQQATEKALKAFLLLNIGSIEIIYTHSIAELLEIAKELDRDFTEVEEAKKLDTYYIPTRYPNGLPGSIPSRYFNDPKEAEEAMESAQKVINLVSKKADLAF